MIALALLVFALLCCLLALRERRRFLREMRRDERLNQWDQMIGRTKRAGRWHSAMGQIQVIPRDGPVLRVYRRLGLLEPEDRDTDTE